MPDRRQRAILAGGGMADVPASRNAAVPYPRQSEDMPMRCLLVDDNGAFLEAASLLLEREGLTVVGVALSIADALREARALLPDLILVDIGLGEESGFDLARLLAQDSQGGGAEVILISTGGEADYKDLIDESPAAGFLAKSALSVRGINRILERTP
jgi:CheY-like chemotaxis protein